MFFKDDYAFLSNMYPTPMVLDEIQYSCAEAVFQAAKVRDKNERKIFENISGYKARELGRSVNLREDWPFIRINVMRWVIHKKFNAYPELAKKLCAIDGYISEDNDWNDKFWGRCVNKKDYFKGSNWLGIILMEERARQRERWNLQ